MAGFNHEDANGRPMVHLFPQSANAYLASGYSIAPQQQASTRSHGNLQYLFGLQDTAMISPKPNKNRRTASLLSENVKHRRTRSGCYTCRSRRVKCDETRPICERCRKGGRGCVYPVKKPSVKTSAGLSRATRLTSRASSSSFSDEAEEVGDPTRLNSISDAADGSEGNVDMKNCLNLDLHVASATQSSNRPDTISRRDSETPSLVQDEDTSPTPSSEGSVAYAAYQTSTVFRPRTSSNSYIYGPDEMKGQWSDLPPDLRFYISYFCENITHFHYSLKFDSRNFLHTYLLESALNNKALLYAVVGFASFQYTLQNPYGKIQDFLQYYDKAVSLLLNSLKKGERHESGTLMAILQLATIEEFLGDWVNLLGHQKAACEILNEIYTPQNAMDDEMSRAILGWYMRFDVFAGLLGGFDAVLSRDWFSYAEDFFRRQTHCEPENLEWKIELILAQNRLIATDMSVLFSRERNGELSRDQFIKENEEISKRIEKWSTEMHPALKDPRFLVNEFSHVRPRDPDDIVDPYKPGKIYTGPLYVMNVAIIDSYSVELLHKYHTSLILKTPLGPELCRRAFEICQMFEAVEYYAGSPPGAVVACQANLGTAALFLPRDRYHSTWIRRKFATIESHGYVYPQSFRNRFADLFGDHSCTQWWIPSNEGNPSMVQSIRKLVEERAIPAKNSPTTDLSDMKAVFAAVKTDNADSRISLAHDADVDVAVVDLAQDYLQEMSGIGMIFDYQQGFWSQRRELASFT